jgi:hypothetical protein
MSKNKFLPFYFSIITSFLLEISGMPRTTCQIYDFNALSNTNNGLILELYPHLWPYLTFTLASSFLKTKVAGGKCN